MFAKTVLLLCAQALLGQRVYSQCTSRAAVDASGIAAPFGWAGPGLAAPAFGGAIAYDGLAAPYCNSRWIGEEMYPAMVSALEFTPTSGGALPVSSASTVAPTGISIVSDNAYEGILEVIGELPFVGTTVVDGVLPTYGAGAINHGCGNGLNGMTALSEASSPASVATAPSIGIGAYAVPALAAPILGAPAIATPAMYAPAIAAPAMYAPGIASPALASPALAYDSMYYGAPCGTGYAYDGVAYATPLEGIEITVTSGGSLPVSSASAVPPTGIIVSTETAYEGPLAVTGELPFVGTVAMDGIVPTAGAGAVNHACGNGINAMASETTAFAPGYASGIYAPAAGIAPAAAMVPGVGYANRWMGRGYGCAF